MSVKSTPRVHCPIEPEVLLANIQGELPIDEKRLVELHLRTCEICQARLRELTNAYDLVASLTEIPVMPTVDVRDEVLRDSQRRLRGKRAVRGLNLQGRALFMAIAGIVSAILIVVVIFANPFFRAHFLSTQRSQNSLSHLTPVGPGVFYAETVKLIPVSVGGAQWDLGEIIAVDEHTGRVVRSLPASASAPFFPELGIGAGTNIHPILSADGRTIIEAAIAADGRNPTAFAVVDSLTGKVRYVQQLAVPTNADPQADPIIHQMWLSPDNTTVYVLTDLAVNGTRSPRLLQFALVNGTQSNYVWPPLDDQYAATALANTTTTIIPSNTLLYSATPTTNAHGQAGINLSFVSITARQVSSTLFIPGDFRFFGMTATPNGSEVLLFNAHTGVLYIISGASRSIIGEVVLSIPGAPPKTGTAQQNSEVVSLVVSPDGKDLFIARDAPDDSPRNFELWAVDLNQQSLLFTNLQPQPFGVVTLSSNGSTIILLRDGGKLETLPAMPAQGQSATPNGWVTLADGAQIIQVIGADAPPAP